MSLRLPTRLLSLACAGLACAWLGAPLHAWADAASPDLPSLPDPVQVTVEAASTAVLAVDLTSTTCSPDAACTASLDPIARVLTGARAAKALVVYSSTNDAGTLILPAVAPKPADPLVLGEGDRFLNTDLDAILQSHGIQTLVIVGTVANGAVLYTAWGANTRGYTVVVLDDGISAPTDFDVFSAEYQMLNQPDPYANPGNTPLQSDAVTLSQSDLVTFR